MDLNLIYIFFNKLKDDSLSFLYHGFMSDEFTDKIISLSEKNLEKVNESKAVKNKVSFLIAESFQNIIRHGDTFSDDTYKINKTGVFMYRIAGETYIITSCNLIKNVNVENIVKKLTRINSLDKEQLKLMYQDIRDNSEFSEQGGAGLGLIDMARKTGNKLEFDFEKIDDKMSYFFLQLKFNSKSLDDENHKKYPIYLSKELYEIINQNNSYLTYKGDFSQENVLVLLEIIERNLQINQFEHESVKSLIFLIFTELLQNISKHGYSTNNIKEGVFLFGKFSKYILSTGNYIANEKVSIFKKNIDSLKNKTKAELQELYVKKIKTTDIDNDGNAGIGIIEIIKECDEINYIISEINDEYSFLTISINL